MARYIRVWQPCEIESLKKHILIVGDISADCGACRELGISYLKAKTCPACQTTFHFAAIRSQSARGLMVKRLKEQRSDLTLVDYEDYKDITGKQSAHELFGP